jgi:hypothetical protein
MIVRSLAVVYQEMTEPESRGVVLVDSATAV